MSDIAPGMLAMDPQLPILAPAAVPEVLTLAEAAVRLGYCQRTVERYVAAGVLQPVRQGLNRVRIPIGEIVRLQAGETLPAGRVERT